MMVVVLVLLLLLVQLVLLEVLLVVLVVLLLPVVLAVYALRDQLPDMLSLFRLPSMRARGRRSRGALENA